MADYLFWFLLKLVFFAVIGIHYQAVSICFSILRLLWILWRIRTFFCKILTRTVSRTEGCPVQAVPHWYCCCFLRLLWMCRLRGIPPHFDVRLLFHWYLQLLGNTLFLIWFDDAKQIIIRNHHTKFEVSSSKRLEVIPSRKMNKNEGTWGGGFRGVFGG